MHHAVTVVGAHHIHMEEVGMARFIVSDPNSPQNNGEPSN